MKPARMFFGGVIGFSLLLSGCGGSEEVEALLPEEIEDEIHEEEEAYVIVSSQRNDEDRDEMIGFVERLNDELDIKEFDARQSGFEDQSLIDVGLEDANYNTLNHFQNGQFIKGVDLAEREYPSNVEREEAIQTFVNQETD